MTENKQSILCVDDDPAILTLLKAELEAHNYTSRHARSGEQAIEILEKQHFDLVILDLNMPGMDGFETLSSLKNMADTAHTPVIFLSAHGRDELKLKGFEHGADDYIVKPFTGPILLARIKAVLRRSIQPVPQARGIQGNVEDLGIFDLLQMLTFSDKCCTVFFPEMNGKIIIDSSDVLSITQSSHSGKEALVRLLLLNQGTFSVQDRNTESSDSEEKIPIDALIFSTAVQIDEIREKIQEALPTSLLIWNHTSDNFQEISNLKNSFPLSPEQLCATMEAPLLDNMQQIVKAIETEAIIPTADT